MIDRQEFEYQRKLLNRRIRYARKKGHNIDVQEIERYIERQNEEDVIEFMKSIRRNELLAYSTGATEDYDYSEDRNDVDWEPPEPTISPDVYSNIEQIKSILLDIPPTVVIQIDTGVLGEINKRIWYNTEEMADKVFDVFQKNVDYFTQNNMLIILDDYYGEEVEDRLAEIIQNWTFNDYLAESDLLGEFTEMLTLLNVGEALSNEELEGFSYVYTDTDTIRNFKE